MGVTQYLQKWLQEVSKVPLYVWLIVMEEDEGCGGFHCKSLHRRVARVCQGGC